jgi:hypothetical protein
MLSENDKNSITLHARDLMSTQETSPKTRPRKLYTFPETSMTPDDPEYCTRTGEKYAICISFFELYQDRIYDLLDDHTSLLQKRRHLALKRDVSTGRRYVSGLRKIYADNLDVSHLPMVLRIGSILHPPPRYGSASKQ